MLQGANNTLNSEEVKGSELSIMDENVVKWRFNRSDPKSKEQFYVESQEQVVRLQRTSVQEYKDPLESTNFGLKLSESESDEMEHQPLRAYKQLNEKNLCSDRICFAPDQFGVMFYIDNQNRLFVCSTAHLNAD